MAIGAWALAAASNAAHARLGSRQLDCGPAALRTGNRGVIGDVRFSYDIWGDA